MSWNSIFFDFRSSLCRPCRPAVEMKNVTHAIRFGRFGNFSRMRRRSSGASTAKGCTEKRRSGIEDHSMTSCSVTAEDSSSSDEESDECPLHEGVDNHRTAKDDCRQVYRLVPDSRLNVENFHMIRIHSGFL